MDDPRKPVRPSPVPLPGGAGPRGGAAFWSRAGSYLPLSTLVCPQNCFELYIPNNKGQLIKACKTEADGRVVEGNHMVYRISAPTQEEKEEWIKSIQ